MSRALFSLVTLACIATLVAVPGCKDGPGAQVYYKDLKPPLGVGGDVKIVSDVSLNPDSGGVINVELAIDEKIDKDNIDRILNSLYRQCQKRKKFRGKIRAKVVDIRLYTSEATAKAKGDDWLARVYRGPSDLEPTFTNKQKPPLAKWARKAMRNAPLFPGELKPEWKTDYNKMQLSVTVPMVIDDGSGKYVEILTFEKFCVEFSSYVITLFEKLDDLKVLTFSAKHNDKVVGTITVTRDQYNALDIKHEEEMLGAFHGELLQRMLSKERGLTEEKLTKLAHAKRREVYTKIFEQLGEGAATVDEDLLKDNNRKKKGKRRKK